MTDLSHQIMNIPVPKEPTEKLPYGDPRLAYKLGHRDARHAAAELAKAATTWQKIETAPKDGERFIAWDNVHGMCVFTTHWDGEEFLTDYESWSGCFSHWMTVPPPPDEP
jgi:hypothetical protein